MATFKIEVLKHHKKMDGTYNVKIRIIHKGKCIFFNTDQFVKDDQLTDDFLIKDPIVNQNLSERVRVFKNSIDGLKGTLNFYSAQELKAYLSEAGKEIDFIKFSKEYIEDLIKAGRHGSANTFKTVVYSLIDYFDRDAISPLEITDNELYKYEKYLRSRRTITRLNKTKLLERVVKGMSDAGVHNHMRDLRVLFKAAMRRYNNPQKQDIRIPCCPFDNFKIVDAPETTKRNLKIEQIILIKNSRVKHDSNMEMSRDLFMLSFYLCGMNAVDLYNLECFNIVNGRIEYNRSKTKGKRKDRAFISIKLIKEAKPLIDKYIGKLRFRYSSPQTFNTALTKGLRRLSTKIGLPEFTFYWARHSFGNIARNKCRVTKDDVAMALNHIDNTHKTTDIYLEKDWKIVDDVQRAVLKYLAGNEKINFTSKIKEENGPRFLFKTITLPTLVS